MNNAPSKTATKTAHADQPEQKKPATAKAPKKTKAPSKPAPTKTNKAETTEQPVPSTAKKGSNSKELASERLKNYMAEIKRLEADKKEISDEIGEVYKAAKDFGFDTDAMKAVLKREKLTKEEREAFDAQIDLYEGVLGLNGAQSEAQEAGIQAASEGQDITANPYTKRDPRHQQWVGGWRMQLMVMATEDEPPQKSEEAADGAQNNQTVEAA